MIALQDFAEEFGQWNSGDGDIARKALTIRETVLSMQETFNVIEKARPMSRQLLKSFISSSPLTLTNPNPNPNPSPPSCLTSCLQCPKPVVSVVHGACVGGAVELIAACDVRLCSADAFFEIKVFWVIPVSR